MAKRLTEHKTTKGNTRMVIKPYIKMSEEFQPVADKLCKLEDVLEKYGIESVEELDKRLMKIHNEWCCQEADLLKIEIDRDTWKKACELAVKELVDKLTIRQEDMFDNKKDKIKWHIDYFYQQAKEGEWK